MPKELVYNSKEYENISMFSNEEITNCQCTIRVNGEYEIHVSLFQALAFSSTISAIYLNERTATIFDIHMEVDGKLDSTLFTKIEETGGATIENLKRLQSGLKCREFIKQLVAKVWGKKTC